MLAYIGCRTTKRRHARGKGIEVYRVTQDAREWEHLQRMEGLVNPSYLVLNRDGDRLYCLHGDRSDISAFAVHPVTGELRVLNQASTGGANPVHLALDPSERFIVVSNHISSSVAVIALGGDGHLERVVDLVELSGKLGPHRVEQPFAKPHANPFSPDGRYLMVPDKGLDCVLVFAFDAQSGHLEPRPEQTVRSREGAGPRHIDFHPSEPLAFTINELDSTVTSYRFDADSGQLTALQVLPSVSSFYTGDNRAAGIVVSPSGRYVLVTNRGEDSLGLFEVNTRHARLEYVKTVASGGKTPRFLGFDPDGQLHVANEDSDNIATFDAQSPSALAKPVHQLSTPSPVCLAFRPD
ncbi:lactonase family protein [Halomonas sp. V046]|uniref:lactonase family protein n=1 Tax=Halomonas sp. V046 TaxID=3459611 RepID=UPI0040444395